jgi:MoxR-like ATPase
MKGGNMSTVTRTKLNKATEVRPWETIPLPEGFSVPEETWRIALRNVYRCVHTCFYGPTGTGKTHLVKLLSEATGKELIPFNAGEILDAITTLKGTIRLVRGQTVFTPSRFILAIQRPNSLILLDEITRIPRDAMNSLFSLLDWQGFIALDEADTPTLVKIAEGVVFFSTANIGTEYSGTNPMDRAFKDRWFLIELGYPRVEDEARIIAEREGIPLEVALKLASFGTECRLRWKAGTLSTPVSTRNLLTAAGLIADGFPLQTALLYVTLPLFYDGEGGGATNDEQVQIKQLIQQL